MRARLMRPAPDPRSPRSNVDVASAVAAVVAWPVFVATVMARRCCATPGTSSPPAVHHFPVRSAAAEKSVVASVSPAAPDWVDPSENAARAVSLAAIPRVIAECAHSAPTATGTAKTTTIDATPAIDPRIHRRLRRPRWPTAEMRQRIAAAEAIRAVRPWNSKDGQRSSACTLRAPTTAPTRRRAWRGNTDANATSRAAPPGTSHHPRLSATLTAATMSRTHRLDRLAATVTRAANSAVYRGSTTGVPVGWQPARAPPPAAARATSATRERDCRSRRFCTLRRRLMLRPAGLGSTTTAVRVVVGPPTGGAWAGLSSTGHGNYLTGHSERVHRPIRPDHSGQAAAARPGR